MINNSNAGKTEVDNLPLELLTPCKIKVSEILETEFNEKGFLHTTPQGPRGLLIEMRREGGRYTSAVSISFYRGVKHCAEFLDEEERTGD